MRFCRTAFQRRFRERVLRTKREAETEEERKERLERAVKNAAVAEDALDMMVKKSIKLHGP